MTYTLRKARAGQEVVKKVTLMLNACKYTQSPYVDYVALSNSTLRTDSFTGAIASGYVTSGYVSAWAGETFYIKNGAEFVACTITTSGSFNVVTRGAFDTTPEQIPVGDYTITHKGQADFSCYGYSQTCSSSGSYDADAIREVVFSASPLAAGSQYHGGLEFKGLNYTAAEIKPGESIGSRSKLSFQILDTAHNDYGLSYYADRQTNTGTLFGKLLARNPYFSGRKVVYSVGLRDAGTLNEPDWEHRTFLIDDANLNNGVFSCTALDALILTEGKKAKMPLQSTAQLTAAITGASTTITFGNAVAGYFGASGNIIVRIDSELIEVTANGTTTMPIVTRGFGHSEIKNHDINATVQNCIRFVNEHVIDCITYALETWTDTPAEYIDDYTATKALIPTAEISDYVLSSPMDVVEFINRCIFLGNLVFYFDDVLNKIIINYVSEFSISPIYLNENDHIKKGSVRKSENIKELYTRFNMSWAPYNLTKETDEKNQQLSLTGINVALESPAQLGETNEKKKMIFPMLTSSSADYLLAAGAINRVISVKEKPDIFECELDAESVGETQGDNLKLGSIVSIQSRENQDKTGLGSARLYQVLNISGDPFESFKVKMKRYQLLEPSAYDFVIEPDTYINYILTDHYNPTIAGQYTVYIKSGAIFGSSNNTLPAFKTGTVSAGVSFKFIARWQVMGANGAGGDAGIVSVSAQQGAAGGTALEVNCDVEIDNGAGIIWGGGGGGDGLPYVSPPYPYVYISRSGGGGGQGFYTALGGQNTNGIIFTDRAPSGTQSAYGAPLSGLSGGAWGEDGGRASGRSTNAGIAIKSNGYNVTITAGDNALSIRGRRT